MSFTNQELLDKLMAMVLKDAEYKRTAAGYNGLISDNGASLLELQVRFFKMGMKGTVPSEWEVYKKALDPEYMEYLRLKKKFE